MLPGEAFRVWLRFPKEYLSSHWKDDDLVNPHIHSVGKHQIIQ